MDLYQTQKMIKLRSAKMRQRIIMLFLLVGIFPSIQAAFACEKVDDRIQFKSMSMEINSSLAMQGCENSVTDLDLLMIDNCCDTTSSVLGHVRNNIQDFSLDKILTLDGAQPPPVLLDNNVDVFIIGSTVVVRLSERQHVKLSASNTYLTTQRFRI